MVQRTYGPEQPRRPARARGLRVGGDHEPVPLDAAHDRVGDVVGSRGLIAPRSLRSPRACARSRASKPGVSVSGGYAHATTMPCGCELGAQRLGEPADRELRRRVRASSRTRRRARRSTRRPQVTPAPARSSTARPRGPGAACRSSRPPSGRGTRRRRAPRSSPGCAAPAFATSTSTGPMLRDQQRRTRARRLRRSVTSAGSAATRSGRRSRPRGRPRRWRAGSRRARRATRGRPFEHLARAAASPMPLEPPVMTTWRAASVGHGAIVPRRRRSATRAEAWIRPYLRCCRCAGPRRRSRTGVAHAPPRSASRRTAAAATSGLRRAGQRRAGRRDRRRLRRRGGAAPDGERGRRARRGRRRQARSSSARSRPAPATSCAARRRVAAPGDGARPDDHPDRVLLRRQQIGDRLRLPDDPRRHAARRRTSRCPGRSRRARTPPWSSTRATTPRTPTHGEPASPDRAAARVRDRRRQPARHRVLRRRVASTSRRCSRSTATT